jgi:hypothetical protein
MMEIRRGDDHDLADAAGLDLEEIPGGHSETRVEFEEEQKKLERAGKISKTATVVMVSSHRSHRQSLAHGDWSLTSYS